MVSDIKTNNTNLLNKIEKLKHDLMGVKVQYDDNLLKIGKAENEKKIININNCAVTTFIRIIWWRSNY